MADLKGVENWQEIFTRNPLPTVREIRVNLDGQLQEVGEIVSKRMGKQATPLLEVASKIYGFSESTTGLEKSIQSLSSFSNNNCWQKSLLSSQRAANFSASIRNKNYSFNWLVRYLVDRADFQYLNTRYFDSINSLRAARYLCSKHNIGRSLSFKIGHLEQDLRKIAGTWMASYSQTYRTHDLFALSLNIYATPPNLLISRLIASRQDEIKTILSQGDDESLSKALELVTCTINEYTNIVENFLRAPLPVNSLLDMGLLDRSNDDVISIISCIDEDILMDIRVHPESCYSSGTEFQSSSIPEKFLEFVTHLLSERLELMLKTSSFEQCCRVATSFLFVLRDNPDLARFVGPAFPDKVLLPTLKTRFHEIGSDCANLIVREDWSLGEVPIYEVTEEFSTLLEIPINDVIETSLAESRGFIGALKRPLSTCSSWQASVKSIRRATNQLMKLCQSGFGNPTCEESLNGICEGFTISFHKQVTQACETKLEALTATVDTCEPDVNNYAFLHVVGRRLSEVYMALDDEAKVPPVINSALDNFLNALLGRWQLPDSFEEETVLFSSLLDLCNMMDTVLNGVCSEHIWSEPALERLRALTLDKFSDSAETHENVVALFSGKDSKDSSTGNFKLLLQPLAQND